MYIFSYAKFSARSVPNFRDKLHQIFRKIRKLQSQKNNEIMKVLQINGKFKKKEGRNPLKNLMPDYCNITAISPDRP